MNKEFLNGLAFQRAYYFTLELIEKEEAYDDEIGKGRIEQLRKQLSYFETVIKEYESRMEK